MRKSWNDGEMAFIIGAGMLLCLVIVAIETLARLWR